MMQTTTRVVRLADAFRNEIRQAHHLGCALDVKTEAGTVYARVTPTTQTARTGMRAAALQDGAAGRDAIEVRQHYGHSADILDAARTAIGHALDIAKTALA